MISPGVTNPVGPILRNQITIRIRRMPHARVTEPVHDVFVSQNAVGEGKIFQ